MKFLPDSGIQTIKAEAYHLGFSLFGIASLKPPLHSKEYETWIHHGYHAEMHYLASDAGLQKRLNPFLILPSAKSMIVLGISYPSSNSLPTSTEKVLTGRIASFAWNQDYHAVLQARLRALANFIREIAGAALFSKGFTDTAPILERDLALQAGLGWFGKNSCLINPKIGSTFFIAELLTDLNLEPDSPFPQDRCGNCSRCLDACPTGCILPNHTIDAGRCIAYLTIEKKGPIPLSLRPKMGNWVFGCDLCQSACPWNQRFAPSLGDPAFNPSPEFSFPDLIHELEITPQEFNQKFKNSPVQRPHRRGYLRNIAIALGNSHDPVALIVLQKTLQTEPESLIRGATAWALHQIDTPEARQVLRNASLIENDPYVLDEIAG